MSKFTAYENSIDPLAEKYHNSYVRVPCNFIVFLIENNNGCKISTTA
ncbi:MAG: hypothetical protein ACTJLM_02050 [Ehrlichia sp.]